VGVKFLYVNDGNGNFTEKKDEPICKDFGFAFANSWSDFDNDGDMDVAIATHSNQKNFMLINNATSINKNNWISLRLIGLTSNKSAIGARIKIVTGNRKQIAEVNAQSGFGGQNSLWNHFGLNTSSVVDSIIIKWPSGIQQIILKQKVNQFLTINEMSSAKVSGNVFQDANNNCIVDGKEKGLANVKIKVTPGNIYATTDKLGNYALRLAPGTYTISVITPTNFSIGCVNKYTITIKSTESIGNKNFALKSSQNGSDMYTNVSATALRRGMKNMIVVEYGNAGNQTSCADTLKIVADSTLKILSADKPWSFKNNNVYSWVINNVNAGEAFTIQMIDSVSRRVEIGTMINLKATISSHCGDLNSTNNQSSFRQKTVGAVDPNEMLVRTNKADNADVVSKTDTLHYRINFQNVGNYEATNIVISSTIPDGLDASTFADEIASHAHHVSINGNVITWQFDSIALPDSAANQIGSNGFIEFSFVPKAEINIGDVILNSAQIQFDYENPIATNKVKSVIAPATTELNSTLQLFPNPANSFINISAGTTADNTPLHLANYSIYNINGQLIVQNNSTALFERVDVSQLQNGWYIINAIDELGNQHSNKFIKE